MTAVGWKARERKWERGNQYQYWVNTSMPTTPSMFVWPVLHTTFLTVLFAGYVMQNDIAILRRKRISSHFRVENNFDPSLIFLGLQGVLNCITKYLTLFFT
jgi:hypothetical protein